MIERFLLSDTGILLCYNYDDRRFGPVDCDIMEKYCHASCPHFKQDGNIATIRCCDMVIELEE